MNIHLSKRIAIMGFVMAAILSSCAPAAPPQPQAAPIKVTFAFSPSPSFSVEAIALQKGYFKEEGLEVEVVKFATGREALQAVLGGAAQVGTVAATPVVLAGFQDQPVAIIADTGRNAMNRITARVASGIKTAADLRGKKIGTPIGTDLHYFLNVFLAANGMSEADVKVVNVAPQDTVVSLSRGDVDAISIWEPNPWKAKKEMGDKVIYLMEPPRLYTAHYLLVTLQGWASKNPDAVVRFLKAVAKAETFLRSNLAEAQTLIGKETETPIEIIQGTWDQYEFGMELSPALVSEMEKQAKWAMDTGRAPAGTKNIPAYGKLVYTAGLKTVKPSAVTLP